MTHLGVLEDICSEAEWKEIKNPTPATDNGGDIQDVDDDQKEQGTETEDGDKPD